MNRQSVMLLIDGDNVSLDVMEQAIPWVHKHYGGPHVCRAYCTPESAVRHQGAFRRLGIRPMVNLAAGKNSTDIALAVDAIDLALADSPGVVVIASSDSDFAPLVMRLREKGCRVVGVGQQGKTGQETQSMYDDFEVMVHQRRGASAPPAVAMSVSSSEDAAHAAPPREALAKRTRSRQPVAKKVSTAKAPASAAAPVRTPSQPSAEVPLQPAARKSPSRRSPRKADAALLRNEEPARPSSRPADSQLNDEARAILQALPELARGGEMALQLAAERLRHAKLLSNRGSSTRLFAHYPDLFVLVPEGRPTRVKSLQTQV